MSVIQSFKKRQLKKQREDEVSKLPETSTNTPMPEVAKNHALTLLAKLCNVAEKDAISTATKYVESNITLDNNVESIESNAEPTALANTTDELADSAELVNQASNDIANATEELKDVAEQVKKPSKGARKSSSGAKKSKAKSSSKK